MDKRSSMRVEVNGQMRGKMLLVESLEILDLSMTGIKFTTARQVDMNCPHWIKIQKNKVSVTIKGTIVRASFKGLQQTDTESMHVYEIAMHFDQLSDVEKKILEKLISILDNE